MSEQKTHAEVIAEMCAREDLDGGDMVDNFDIYIGEYGGWDALKLIKAYADRLNAAHKREITILRDALAEVVASIEVRFPAIEYALDRKPYLDAKKILEQYKEEAK